MSSSLPPDTGTQAWLTIIGAWIVNFSTFGYINAFDISWIGSFQLFMMYAPGLFVGRAFDAGYFHHIMISGSIIYVISMFMLSLVRQDQYYQAFLSQGLGMGIGQGMLFLPALTIVNHHFRRRKALATGIVVTGASAGGIIFPIMLEKLSHRFTFPNAIRATAALVAVLLILANSLMRTRLEPNKLHQPSIPPSFHSIITDLPFTTSILGAFLTNLGLFFPYFYLQLYAEQHGVSPKIAFYSLALLNAGSVLGRLLPTFLADRLGVYNMLILSILTSAALLFAMFGINRLSHIIVFGLLFGFSSGAYVSLIPSLISQLTTHMGELGFRMGFAFSVVAFSMLVGTPIEGALLTHRLIWSRPIVFCGVCTTFGFLLMTLSRLLFIRRKGGKWWQFV